MRPRDPFRRPGRLTDSVYAYVAYRIGAGSAAQDVTGEALLRAWRGRSTYDPDRGAPESWVIGIARRVLAERSQSPEVLVEQVPDRPDVRDEQRQSLDRVSIAHAMQQLGDRDRELLALRYGADLSAQQIADLLHIEVNAAEVALSRARGRLRKILDPPDRREERPNAVLEHGV
ncbi:MAG: RNA polymerase sigma factor [Gaiellales bacterium]